MRKLFDKGSTRRCDRETSEEEQEPRFTCLPFFETESFPLVLPGVSFVLYAIVRLPPAIAVSLAFRAISLAFSGSRGHHLDLCSAEITRAICASYPPCAELKVCGIETLDR